MAAIAVTYTFTNGTTSDGTQVSQNFTDLVNGLGDGTKDIAVNAISTVGNATFNGNTIIGNATGDDVTIGGSLAATLNIKTTNAFDIGTSAIGLRAFYFGANSKTAKIVASASQSADWTFTLPIGGGTAGYYLQTNGSGTTTWAAFTPPTSQIFTTGSGTYTTPANVKYITVIAAGGGGGGGGSGTAATAGAGGTGGNTTLGVTMVVANGSTGGGVAGGSGAGGAGGSASIGAAATGIALSGGRGGNLFLGLAGGDNLGSPGAPTPLGGFSGQTTVAGQSGVTNTGAGGSGAGVAGALYVGAGGGAGGYVMCTVSSPAATYAYAVGTGGTAGTSGTGASKFAGGPGANGYLAIFEYYQ